MADGSPIIVEPVLTPYGEHLLPPNATPLQIALSGSDHRVMSVPVWVIRAVWSPDDCPVALMPYLAQAWSVDEWDPQWSEAAKRQAIKDAVWLHRHKGTIGALKRAITQLGLGARVSRWFEHGGAPYTFRLFVGIGETTEWPAENFGRLLRVAINNKAVRSFLDRIVWTRPAPATPVYLGAAVLGNVRTRILVDPVNAITTPRANVAIGAAIYARVSTRLSPMTA